MKMLTQRKKSMEIARIIDDALYEYYVVERDEEVPNWRYIKDADWWLEYLDSLGIDRRNP
jgi:DNA-binding transcriptional ArsR family regulator